MVVSDAAGVAQKLRLELRPKEPFRNFRKSQLDHPGKNWIEKHSESVTEVQDREPGFSACLTVNFLPGDPEVTSHTWSEPAISRTLRFHPSSWTVEPAHGL